MTFERLAKRRIYRTGDVSEPNRGEPHPVIFPKAIRIEPYVSFRGGGDFCTMGAFSYTMTRLPSSIQIGRYCSIASLNVFGEQHPIDRATTSAWSYRHTHPVVGFALRDFHVTDFPFFPHPNKPPPVIRNDVWVGQGVTLALGITVGDGAILGANANVTKSVESFSIVGGNPARVIRQRFPDKICERLAKVRWWDYALPMLPKPDLRDPERFADQMEAAIGTGLQPYQPEALDGNGLVQLVNG